MNDKVSSEILRWAADYLAENGHVKGTAYDYPKIQEGLRARGYMNVDNPPNEIVREIIVDGVPSCAMGAIGAAAARLGLGTYSSACDDATDHLQTWLTANTEQHWTAVPAWNDYPSTSMEDVILAMKRAAEE